MDPTANMEITDPRPPAHSDDNNRETNTNLSGDDFILDRIDRETPIRKPLMSISATEPPPNQVAALT
jgi:hypothetical protein